MQPAARRLVLPVLLVIPVVLAACGPVNAPSAGPSRTKSATGTPAASHSPRPRHSTRVKNGTAQPTTLALGVCRVPGSVSEVAIKVVGLHRMGALQPRLRPRYDWVITNPAKASALAASACALPPTERVAACPNPVRGYELVFSAAGRQFPMVTVQVAGCMVATGLGTPRSVSRADAGSFWALLTADTNSPPPDGIPPTS